jgi:hypothetical protein
MAKQNPYLSETDQPQDEFNRILQGQIASQLGGEKPAAGPYAPANPDTPLVTKPGNEQVSSNPFGALTLRQGTQQPGQTAGPVAPPTTPSPAAPPSGNTTGWGYNSPTGGRQEFSYTGQDFGNDMTGFSGFSPKGEGSSDPTALKNVYRDVAMGLGGGEGGFTEADVDETVRRLNAMGIPATKVDPYQIDFGMGEGPMQVRTSNNEVWWNNRATEGQAPGAAESGGATGMPGMSTPTINSGGGDTLSAIQKMIQDLMKSGYSTEAVQSLLQG